ncbi:hypothetical protein C0Q70_02731 [Pomacea canaliculata]|uniref:Chloride channel CLIC-like protein 1 n=2 Tax=Pomacea canaliculata TaxID=400727 RepID=A0A2T7PQS8_POMCA|nr:chloride channel CLIC-like protein 1 isoform X2 [Pomacea canaliculata]XP_025077593.1 chloride channel CLIC-like protein 1 isoform X2 [Pomacea canaliculata]XP_025077602.1 chloride channel CLIC-like protein 1 isoform X2 [Pomacea canaliculata]PVD35768.1 hypothetical protein C0Q70_02731 [Pomacea canaliculata]
MKNMRETIVKCIILMHMLYSACAVQSVDTEEINPFDMVNFDLSAMKMMKDKSSSKGQKVGATADIEKDAKEPVVSDGSKEQTNPSTTDASPQDIPEGIKNIADDMSTTRAKPVTIEKVERNSCPALSLFRQFVTKLLHFADRGADKMDETKPIDMCLHLRLTQHHLSELKSFSRDPLKDGVHSAHDVLTEAMLGTCEIDADDSFYNILGLEDKQGFTLKKLMQVLALIFLGTAILLLLSKLHFSFNLIIWVLFTGFVISVGTTWYRLYQGEVARQHEAMLKDLPSGCIKQPDDPGMLNHLVSLVRTYFTFQKDECIEYYEHLIVDPLVKVSIMEALAVAVVQTLLKPLRTIGTEVSQFLRAVLKDLPVQWQFGTILILIILFVITLLVCCNYRIRVPFLLAIEPAPSSCREQVHELKAIKLQQKLSKLESTVKNNAEIRTSQQSAPLNERYPYVLEQQSVTLQQRLKKSEPAVENVAASTSKQSASQQSCFNSSEALSTKEKWLSGSEPFPQIFLPEEEVKRSLEKDDSLTEHNVEVT